MKRVFTLLVFLLVTKTNGDPGDFRPPAVPLIVFSPHISVWSFSDQLTDSDTVHWSGSSLGFHGLIELDDSQTYRFLGTLPSNVPALIQDKVVVEPYRTNYTFTTPEHAVELVVTFSQPTSMGDPYTYITFSARTLDQKSHKIRIYFDEDPTLSINDKGEKVYWSRMDGDVTVLTMNAYTQIPFGIRGDTTRNNWGYAHLIAKNDGISTGYQAFGDDLRSTFANHQSMPSDDTDKPRHADNRPPTSAFVLNLGTVASEAVSAYVVFLYDDVYSMVYFEEYQIPCWRAELDNNITLLVNEAISNYDATMADITNTNQMIITHLKTSGGDHYASLASLVTRQVTGALSQTWSNQQNRPLLYLKEISSSGNINTVDLIFPASPFFLWLHPELLRDVLIPILGYVNNDTNVKYNLAWAPHHLGTWSVCSTSPDEQLQMPMEETANMLLMLAGVVQRLNTTDFLQPYWNVLESWAQFLNSTLPDPPSQISTDVFEGPAPHQCNLALKGILSLGAYSIILNADGQTQRATVYMNQAQNHANFWLKAARDDNNYRLQYDLPHTWSQKYNLVYQYILSLKLFPDDVAKLESAYYQTQLLDYGVPLDSRGKLTKSDWSSWIAAFAPDQSQAIAIFDKLYRFVNESTDRFPFSDFYDASNGHVLGFRARPVLGALFARVLIDNPSVTEFYMKSKRSSIRRANKCNTL